jgi:error-prone DNA polymerase
MVRGLSNIDAARILAARAERPFSSIDDVWRRSGVPAAALEKLTDADAFRGFGLDRRQALWEVRALGAAPLPLFAAADAREGQWAPEGHEPAVRLTPLKEGREVVEDYRSVQLSLRAHPLTFLRPELDARGAVACADLQNIKDGRKVKLAGIVLIRQRPGSANNVTFVTIEDESGVANIIIWQRLFEAQRRVVLAAAMMGVTGRVQKEGAVIHVIADDLQDLSGDLRAIGGLDFPHRTGPGDGAKNGGYDARDKNKDPVKARDLFHPPFRHGPRAQPEAMPKPRDSFEPAFRPKPYPGEEAPAIKVKSRDFH